MENMATGARTEVLEAARSFARAIGGSSQFQEYEQAEASIKEDREAQTLLTEYQEAQQTLQMLQSWSGGNSHHAAQFRELEEKVLQHPKLRRYFNAQEGLVSLIQRLNRGLGEELGFDFARLAKPAGGCC
jgi:cell fate (sporulation/competence/biofilm development) regulator YlbF (YheA/YmcA/DUF963 family)